MPARTYTRLKLYNESNINQSNNTATDKFEENRSQKNNFSNYVSGDANRSSSSHQFHKDDRGHNS